MSEPCPFCDRSRIERDLIYETANFSVFQTLGQVVEGYLLIVPKRHIICLGNLTLLEMEEYITVHELVCKKIQEAYGQRPIFFEHGIVGQTVKHAHMHAAPTTVDLFLRIKADLEGGNFTGWKKITSLKELQAVFQQFGPYLFYQNNQGEMFLFEVFKYPQYLRIVFAEEAGVPERGNWRAMDRLLDDELILNTRKKLSAIDWSL